jgi:hypothetical protein
MASTPTFGWPTPDDTDPVKRGAEDIRALGDAVDATVDGIDGRLGTVEGDVGDLLSDAVLTSGNQTVGGVKTFTEKITLDRNLADTEQIVDFDVHRGFDIRRIGATDSTAGLYLNSRVGNNQWGVSHAGSPIADFETDGRTRLHGNLQVDGATNFSGAVNRNGSAAFLYAGTRYFFSGGSFSPTDPLLTGDIGLRAVRVRMVGGGGGGRTRVGSASNAVWGSGGAGGGYSEKFYLRSAITSTVTVGVGSGGGPNASGTDSTFLGMTASGGSRGGIRSTSTLLQSSSDVGGAGASGGDLNIAGDQGEAGSYIVSGYVFSGAGGSSMFSAGTPRTAALSAGGKAGFSAGGFGGGASSGVGLPGAIGTISGGSGSNGLVIIDCYV